MSKHDNPKNNFVPTPLKYIGKFYNACTDPCDMLQGPCACGAGHSQEEWPDSIQLEVFGNVSKKETILKRTMLKEVVVDTSLYQIAKIYVMLKKERTNCLQSHFKQLCARCELFAQCSLYEDYVEAWIRLERLVK